MHLGEGKRLPKPPLSVAVPRHEPHPAASTPTTSPAVRNSSFMLSPEIVGYLSNETQGHATGMTTR